MIQIPVSQNVMKSEDGVDCAAEELLSLWEGWRNCDLEQPGG